MNLPYAKKSLGQHWLEDTPSLQAMVESAAVKGGDTVLEIGPGTGTLTDELIAAGAEVIALEFDHDRAQALQKKYQSQTAQVTVQEGDIRSFDLASLPRHYKIVANIPYYLTANLLRKLTDTHHKPEMASLLVQKEVAERVTAVPGKLSQLAVFTQVYYSASCGRYVAAELFTPPPKVDSQILILKKRQQPVIEPSEKLFMVVKAGFGERRKMLRSSLSKGLGISKEQAEAALHKAGVDPHARGQELSLAQWGKLARVLP